MSSFQKRLLLSLLSAGMLLTGPACVRRSVHQRTVADLQAASNEGALLSNQLKACESTAKEKESTAKESVEKLQVAEQELERMRQLTGDLAADLSETTRMNRELKARQQPANGLGTILAELTSRLATQSSAGQLVVEARGRSVVIRIPESTLFEPTSTQVKAAGVTLLGEVAMALQTWPERQVQVGSHLDSAPFKPSANAPGKLEFCALRSIAVTRQLTSQGLSSRAVLPVSIGDLAPLPGIESVSKQNRRVELVIMPTQDELPPLNGSAPASTGTP